MRNRTPSIRVSARKAPGGPASAFCIAVPVALVKKLGDGYQDHKFKPELTDEGILFRLVTERSQTDE